MLTFSSNYKKILNITHSSICLVSNSTLPVVEVPAQQPSSSQAHTVPPTQGKFPFPISPNDALISHTAFCSTSTAPTRATRFQDLPSTVVELLLPRPQTPAPPLPRPQLLQHHRHHPQRRLLLQVPSRNTNR